jgi:tetrahydromethanopterin S-methyltransferase subunit C
MVRRMAGTLSLLAFAVCLVAGLSAGNSTTTVLSNALFALAVTFVVGLVVGAMAQKMLDENIANVSAEAAKAAASEGKRDGAARVGGDEKK